MKTVASALLATLVSTSALAAPREEARTLAGLEKPAEIRVDRWGIAHIYAGDVRDAFFLQGYNVAGDRLWQIDLWRKRGLGLLAKDFGPSYVAQDRAARLFLYRGDMDREWAAYGPGAKDNTEAFVAGVNAYVTEIRSGKRPLPAEFKLAGSTPDLWSAQDVVRIRSHGLTRNVPNEVGRAKIACAAGLEAAKLYRHIEPKWETKIPEGLDPCGIPDDVLADYQLATSGVKFTGAGPKTAMLEIPPDAIGSNNWTVAASRTATGRPILANDPHREHSAPSLRYIVHMEAPGFSVIGAGEPALPGVSIGHNGTVAFGLTIFPADQEDLYVYETDAKSPTRYRYDGGWADMTTVTEDIAVKGEAVPRKVELAFTRHGPVIYAVPAKGRAFAVRSVWAEPGTSAYFGSMGYMTAKTWEGFKGALADWGAPSENQVYADTKGDIGWVAAGKVPRRANWDGLLPVPGDGRYEWKGFLKLDELPSAHNPASGWFASANQMNLPADYPYAERKVGFEWSNPSRMQRIAEVLAAKPKLTLADAKALQTDPYDITSRRMLALLAGVKTTDPKLASALTLLRGWDHRTAADSPGAALYEVWVTKHLGKATVARAVPQAARAAVGNGDLPAVMALLEAPDATLGADPAKARDEVLTASLLAAYDEVAARLGPQPNTWAWGKLHQARFDHALSPLAPAPDREAMSSGTLPMAGTSLSPLAATWRPDDYRVIAGASFRMVLDVGAWDNSVAINTPGQSGGPGSAHYRDLFPIWAKGDYVPLSYSRKAVEAATESVLKLTPAP
ncbi:penicillin acylase family protein [Phenylobacterium sp. Root700]|uniref:penicillin acylase family protein n=1 Tax=Phenylobacterium sp. Root700 TaxID=1736591 RepID=UPI0006FBD790|nr:penicillin acylase family protein [Phenylobacterium sp. Root700]KRB41022.1 PbsX family transcriptional regulator [Phenylobacterium sp. Root700]